MVGSATGLEGLDDEHAATAAGAWLGERLHGLIGFGDLLSF
jgi:hypothetical protein